MAYLTISEVSALKQAVQNRFAVQVHFHDCCGGQAFTLDRADGQVKAFILSYFAARNLQVFFSDDGLQFRVQAKI